ncbi:MAG TPA: hypothetical protein VNQ90_08480 [Chthoniobacteraceae bacterium]|nr:hypothetical protein [Chthoniobacteraceae bacterium]
MNETTKRYALIAVAVGLGFYVYFSILLGPLAKKEADAQQKITKLTPLISKAESLITRTKAIAESDTNAARAKVLHEIIDSTVPGGSSVVWLPERLDQCFRPNGVPRVTSRLVNEQADPQFTDYKRSQWDVEIARIPLPALGKSLAQFENQEGLAQITQLQIDTLPTHIEAQRVRFRFTTVVK